LKTNKDLFSQLDLFSQPEEIKSGGNIVIFKSSAGSGKTFALVKEILKILLMDPAQYQHILSVTFTNEATKKMKTSIIEELSSISSGTETETLKIIKQELEGMNIPFQKRAYKALKNILHNYSRFEISTIDHFFTHIIRALAWELNLPISYEIDVDNETALESAIEKLYADLTENEEIRNWLEDFAFSKLEEDKGWNIEYNIKELGLQLFEERYHLHKPGKDINIEELSGLVERLKETRNMFVLAQKSLAKEAINLVNKSQLKWSDFKGGSRSVIWNFDKIIKGNLVLTDTFKKLAAGNEEWFSQKSFKKDEINELVKSGLGEISNQILTNHQQLYHNYNTSVSLLKNIYTYGLLDLLDEKLSEYKEENNLVLLSDSAIILSNINNYDVPFIYEKMGSTFNHFLIDEFQDTSDFQWKNFKPLMLNAASENNKILIAGDVKQSIYRWRGGNMNLLIHGVRKTFQDFQTQINERKLDRNWRSGINIVKFNNAFFSLASSVLGQHSHLEGRNELMSEAYLEVIQKAEKDNHGYVQIKFLDGVDGVWDSWTENAKKETVEAIKESKGHGFDYKDIMILVDVGWQANELSDFLTKHQIPAITESSLLVENSPLIRLIISTMEWVVDPNDEVAFNNIAHQYNVINGSYPDSPHDLFTKKQAINYLPEGIENLMHEISSKPLYELVEEIIILFKLNLKADIFLNRFQDICLEQSGKGIETVRDFIPWWKDKLRRHEKNQDLSVIMPADSNAVRIMTIHKAKGLESPIVIVPFAGSKFELKTRKNTTIWVNELPENLSKYESLPVNFSDNLVDSDFIDAYKDELLEGMIERLNVVYVAFTRPQERLYIFSYNSKSRDYGKGIENLQKLLTRVLEHPSFEYNTNFDAETNQFIMGEKSAASPREKLMETKPISEYPASPYQEKARVRDSSQKFFMITEHEKAVKIKEGIQLHSILEKLNKPSELDNVILKLQQEGIFRISETQMIKERVEDLLENSQFKSWFSPDWKVMNERKIIHEGNAYKPDRVLLKKNSAVVIDYKREKRDKKHEKQINEYAAMLAKMGIKSIQKYLVYTVDFEILEIE